MIESRSAQKFELDKNGFVKLTKRNAILAQEKVNTSVKNTDGKKSSKTRKTLSAIRDDDYEKNDLFTVIQDNKKKNFVNGFLDIIEKINATNSTRLSVDEQKCFAAYIDNNDEILKRIKQGDLDVVNDIAEAGTHTSKNRYNFSFASKFCTYVSRYVFNEFDKFMPYDKVLQNILPYYAWSYCGEEFVPNFKEKRRYGDYIKLVRKIIKQGQFLYGVEGKLTLKEFDRLLWYKYKGLPGEDLIGLEIFRIKEA